MQPGTRFRRTKHACLTAWVVGLFTLTTAPAQSAARAPTGPSLLPGLSYGNYDRGRQWGRRTGLPSSSIADIAETSDGYLWVATRRGVVRFDGQSFTVLKSPRVGDPRAGFVTRLLETRDGTLWIGTEGGLWSRRPETKDALVAAPGLEEREIRALFEDSGGTLWVGTDERTWEGRFGALSPSSRAPAGVRAVCETGGTLWLWSPTGMHTLARGQLTRVSEIRGVPLTDIEVNVLHGDPDGTLWIGTVSDGLIRVGEDRIRVYTAPDDLRSNDVRDILLTRSGTAIVAAGGLIRVTREDVVEPIVKGPPEWYEALAEDREGSLWYAGLWLQMIRNGEDVHYPLHPGRALYCVLPRPGGGAWFGDVDGVHLVDGEEITSYGPSDGLPDSHVRTLSCRADGSLYLGTRNGLALLADGRVLACEPSLRGQDIAVLHADTSGALWIGWADGGACRIQEGDEVDIAGLESRTVYWFYEDPDRTVWIGTDRGLFTATGSAATRFPGLATSELGQAILLTHYVDDEGALWMGTDGRGLCRWKDGRLSKWSRRDGLEADTIYSVHEDNHHRLWFVGPTGVFYAKKTDFEDFEEGKIGSLGCRPSRPHLEGASDWSHVHGFPRAGRTEDGALWLLTKNNRRHVPADRARTNLVPPHVHVEEVVVDGQVLDRTDGWSLMSGRRRITIRYTATTFILPQRARFKYRLDGHDPHWIDNGTERTAVFADLAPGSYTFRVTGDNGYGVWCERDASIAFTITPRLWETWWFRVLGVLILLAMLWGFADYRTRAVRRRNSALLHEMNERARAEENARRHRDNLARVLRAASMGELVASIAHQVNQPLFAIVANSQMARRIVESESPDVDELTEIVADLEADGNRAAKTIAHLRALVQKHERTFASVDLNDVVRGAVGLVESDANRKGIRIECALSEDLPAIEGDVIELEQMLLNLLNNGAQAMQSTADERRTLRVETRSTEANVEVSVIDHGVGLEPQDLDRIFEPFYSSKPDGMGMGLAISKTIVEGHGGRIWATSNPDGGATLHVRFPIAEKGPPYA